MGHWSVSCYGVSVRRRLRQFRPQLSTLEGRLLPGDTLLGFLAAQASFFQAELPMAVVSSGTDSGSGGLNLSPTPAAGVSGSIPATAVVNPSNPAAPSRGSGSVTAENPVVGNDPLASAFAADPLDSRSILPAPAPPAAPQVNATAPTGQPSATPIQAASPSPNGTPVQAPPAITILPVSSVGRIPFNPATVPPFSPPPIPGGSWKTYQHDTAHTGQSPASFDPASVRLAWSAPQGYSVPLLLGNYAVAMRNQQGVGTDVTSISAFALADGTIEWTYTGQFTFPSQPTFGNGLIVFAASPEDGSGFQLFVLDALTGNLEYTVPLEAGFDTAPMPTVARNPDTGTLEAFVATANTVFGIELDAGSGTVLWSQTGTFGGFSMPTVVGDSVIVAGPGHYYAFDQATGATNQFHTSDLTGGGGTTVAYDANLGQFYVLEYYDNASYGALTAYGYSGNSQIRQVWQVTGPGTPADNSVAIGPNEDLYMLTSDSVQEISPHNGQTLRVLNNQNLATGVTPILSDGYLWALSGNRTLVYNLSSFTLNNTLLDLRGSLNSAYDSPGALGQGYYLMDYGDVYGRQGFDVYATPS